MAVTPEDIAVELGRTAPTEGTPTFLQWNAWIDRALRTIDRRAVSLGATRAALDPEAVDDVVTYAVVRRATRPVDGAESTTDQVSVDDGSVNQTRRWSAGAGDIHFLDQWWELLGLSEPVGEWAGSISYARR